MKKNLFYSLISITLLFYLASCNKDTQECMSISCPATFQDARDGKTYKAVAICNQCWMAQNLNFVARYNSWCFNNNPLNCATYGRLYDWAAVMQGSGSSTGNPSGVKGICPDGWHVPSDAEWKEMVDYLGGPANSGGALKDTSSLWQQNVGGNNSSGFSALPGGYYDIRNDTWKGLGSNTGYWTATQCCENNTISIWWLYGNSANASSDVEEEGMRLSLRCVKNN